MVYMILLTDKNHTLPSIEIYPKSGTGDPNNWPLSTSDLPLSNIDEHFIHHCIANVLADEIL